MFNRIRLILVGTWVCFKRKWYQQHDMSANEEIGAIGGLAEAVTVISKSLDHKRRRMEATPVLEIHKTFVPKTPQITNCYYMLTVMPAQKRIDSCKSIFETDNTESSYAGSDQSTLLGFSNKLFEGTRPLVGIELQALYLAMKKQRESSSDSLL